MGDFSPHKARTCRHGLMKYEHCYKAIESDADEELIGALEREKKALNCDARFGAEK